MANIDRPSGTIRRAAAASFADGADDLADVILLVELDGAVRTEREAGFATGAELRIHYRVHRVDGDLSLGDLAEDTSHGGASLGDRLRNIPGELTGAGDVDAVGGRGHRVQLGVT